MLPEDRYFLTLTKEEIWKRYCGFLDLTVDEFLDIQKNLLTEEIDRVWESQLGKRIIGEHKPASIDEFRRYVRLTQYQDYEPYLPEKQEDVLSGKPSEWVHSSGRGGHFKWIPQSKEAMEKAVKYYLASFILSSSRQKGEVNIGPGMRMLLIVAPRPYLSGAVMHTVTERFTMRAIPPLDDADKVDFRARLQKGFEIALKDGVDVIGAIASILVKMAEAFDEKTSNRKISPAMLYPQVLGRFASAYVKSKKEHRKIMPKDLWGAKGIVTSGMDTAIYRNDVIKYWGSSPYEFYAGTEGIMYAMQAWDRDTMYFVPDLTYFEFLPQDEKQAAANISKNGMPTVLLNEIQTGVLYEPIITQLYGMPLMRYHTNDLIVFDSKVNSTNGMKLPGMHFQRRQDEFISLASLCKLDERTIWQAIANTGIKYAEWAALKELDTNQSYCRIYLELKEKRDPAEIAVLIDNELKKLDVDYLDLDKYLKLQPIKITPVAPGTFQRYSEDMVKEGRDIAHLKPPHINAPSEVIQRIVKTSEEIGGSTG